MKKPTTPAPHTSASASSTPKTPKTPKTPRDKQNKTPTTFTSSKPTPKSTSKTSNKRKTPEPADDVEEPVKRTYTKRKVPVDVIDEPYKKIYKKRKVEVNNEAKPSCEKGIVQYCAVCNSDNPVEEIMICRNECGNGKISHYNINLHLTKLQ